MDNNTEGMPRWNGPGYETERVPYTREQMIELSATLQRGAEINLSDAFKGRLVAVLCASGSILIERNGYPDVEIQMMDSPVIN